MVIAMQRARTVVKEATLRVVPEDPDIDGAAAEPRAALVEAQTRAIDSPMSPAAALDNSIDIAPPTSPDEAEELLEESWSRCSRHPTRSVRRMPTTRYGR
jgi:hypothetical protein